MLEFLEALVTNQSGAFVILVLVVIMLTGLIILVPQLLRAHLRKAEMMHLEHMKALENGVNVPIEDDRSRFAARTAMLVPMVVMITAGTVTCFVVAYKSEQLFTVTLAIWVVAGVVSLAAITGGVALIGRLASLQAGKSEEEEELEYSDDPMMK